MPPEKKVKPELTYCKHNILEPHCPECYPERTPLMDNEREVEELAEIIEDCKKHKYASNTIAYFITKSGWVKSPQKEQLAPLEETEVSSVLIQTNAKYNLFDTAPMGWFSEFAKAICSRFSKPEVVLPSYKQVRFVTHKRQMFMKDNEIKTVEEKITYDKEAEIWNACLQEVKRLNGMDK